MNVVAQINRLYLDCCVETDPTKKQRLMDQVHDLESKQPNVTRHHDTCQQCGAELTDDMDEIVDNRYGDGFFCSIRCLIDHANEQ